MKAAAQAPASAQGLNAFLDAPETRAVQRDLGLANCYLALKEIPDSISWLAMGPDGMKVLEFSARHQYGYPADAQYQSRFTGVREATAADLSGMTEANVEQWKAAVVNKVGAAELQVTPLPITADYEPSISEGDLVRPPLRAHWLARQLEDLRPTHFPAVGVTLPRGFRFDQ